MGPRAVHPRWLRSGSGSYLIALSRLVDRVWAVVGAVALVSSATVSVAASETTAAGAAQGNIVPALAPPNGKVAVGAVGAAVDDRVAVVIQNGGTKPARIDLVTATSTSAEGATVTRARSVEAFPQVVAPGELALASVQFRRTGVPPGAQVAAKVRSTPVRAARAARVLTVSAPLLSAPQTGEVAQTLDATVTNLTTNWTARGAKVAVMCFGEARDPTTVTTAPLVPAKLAPGKHATISVPLTLLCPTYLVAARAS